MKLRLKMKDIKELQNEFLKIYNSEKSDILNEVYNNNIIGKDIKSLYQSLMLIKYIIGSRKGINNDKKKELLELFSFENFIDNAYKKIAYNFYIYIKVFTDEFEQHIAFEIINKLISESISHAIIEMLPINQIVLNLLNNLPTENDTFSDNNFD